MEIILFLPLPVCQHFNEEAIMGWTVDAVIDLYLKYQDTGSSWIFLQGLKGSSIKDVLFHIPLSQLPYYFIPCYSDKLVSTAL